MRVYLIGYSSAIKKSHGIIFGKKKIMSSILLPFSCLKIVNDISNMLLYNKSLKAQEVKLTTVIT